MKAPFQLQLGRGQTIHRLGGALPWLALIGILGVAAYTRFLRLDLIDFKADEAELATLAQAVVHGAWPATSIPTSLGPDNPPLPVYLFALP
ncbi:MAG: hypothetical protein JOZ39_09705, partial [Chloroflexi bacterium]|nr:hypothetical protein [Chloroflexota bacterium]